MKTEAYVENLQLMLEEKKSLISQLSVKKNELQAHVRRNKREEFRILREQQRHMKDCDSDVKKDLYGNVEKRDANLFKRKEEDDLYQQYKAAEEKTNGEIQVLELEYELKRQEEKYLFKETEMYTTTLNYEAKLHDIAAKMPAEEASAFYSKYM